MNRIAIAVLSVAIVGTSLADLPEISNVVARQRWPWSAKVDIDFAVGEGDECDLALTATYDGCTTPLDLSPCATNISLFGVKGGIYHFVWDPSSAGLADTALSNFKVTVSAAPAASRKYLVLDISAGTHAYLADVPAGGWTDEHKTRLLVLRRIPSGTYTLGYPSDIVGMAFPDTGNVSLKNVASARTVTISEPYYIAVFPTTIAQHLALTGDASSSNKKPKSDISYNGLRGACNTDGIDWPSTRFEVSAGSAVKAWREKFRASFPKSWVLDLPTAAQWEAAARAGASSTLWYSGGLSTDSSSTLSGYLSAIAVWNGSPEGIVGTKASNEFGLYDMVGNRSEWLLDYAFSNTSVALGDSTDPVGEDRKGTGSNRLVRGGMYNDRTFFALAIGNPAKNELPTATYISYRLCINTSDWTAAR